MAKVISVKHAKAPVETVTVELSKWEASDVLHAMKNYFGATDLVRNLQDVLDGKRSPFSLSPVTVRAEDLKYSW